MRNFVLATLCVVLVLSRPAVSQNAQQPSRQAVLEHDGVVWASPAAWGAPFQDDLPEDLKIAGLGKLWMEVKINFPHFAGVADLDWDKTYLDFIPKVRATASTYEYYRVLQRMCALLRDGHTEVFLPKPLAERMEADLPLRIDLIENRVFVTRVESKTLELNGITAGLEILRVDGVPVHEYAETKRLPYIASNSPQHVAVKLYSYGLLSGVQARPVDVEFRAQDGTVFERRLERGPYRDKAELPVFEYRKLAGNVAYVAINSFSGDDAQKGFESHLVEIQQSAGLILDVRQNDGGSGATAYNLIGYLTDKDFVTTPWRTRQYIATLRAWGQPGGWYEAKPSTWASRPAEFYAKPVVMLIGPRCLSATDVFADTFRRLRRGKLVGEPTGGSIGDPVAFALPGGGSARVATSAEIGDGFVGRGIQPDVIVPRTVQDLLAGRDAVLEAGLAELMTSVNAR